MSSALKIHWTWLHLAGGKYTVNDTRYSSVM